MQVQVCKKQVPHCVNTHTNTHTYACSILARFMIDVCETQNSAEDLSAETSLLRDTCGLSVPGCLNKCVRCSVYVRRDR